MWIMETEPEVPIYTEKEQTEIYRLEFEIRAVGNYLLELQAKYFYLTGEHIE